MRRVFWESVVAMKISLSLNPQHQLTHISYAKAHATKPCAVWRHHLPHTEAGTAWGHNSTLHWGLCSLKTPSAPRCGLSCLKTPSLPHWGLCILEAPSNPEWGLWHVFTLHPLVPSILQNETYNNLTVSSNCGPWDQALVPGWVKLPLCSTCGSIPRAALMLGQLYILSSPHSTYHGTWTHH